MLIDYIARKAENKVVLGAKKNDKEFSFDGVVIPLGGNYE